jgi:hypothetical protein
MRNKKLYQRRGQVFNVPEVLDSNLGPKTTYLTEGFLGFLQSPQKNTGV